MDRINEGWFGFTIGRAAFPEPAAVFVIALAGVGLRTRRVER